jgi:sarcosine oxidase subunit beta
MAEGPDRGARRLPGGKPKYSVFSLMRNARRYHQDWQQAWRAPEPKKSYDAIIIGGGGHGLATAYYLAAVHRITNIAVIEKGWLGGGNTGRNTTIIRSNYMWDESAAIYDHALKLWEGLTQDLNFNLMFSQRGVLTIAHSWHELREMSRRVHAIRLNGIDSDILTPDEIKKLVPIINIDQSIRYPVMGGFLQRRGGTARHDAGSMGICPRRR